MTTPATNSFPDPQATIAAILRPPDDFESLYQGVARSSPIPFVQADGQDRFLPVDFQAGNPEMSEFLARYVRVPIGATMMLLIPRALYLLAGEPAEGTDYLYELRWRLRTQRDHNTSQEQFTPFPYSLEARRGAYEDDPNVNRILIPAWTSEVIDPAAVGNRQLPIISGGAADPQVGYATQGLYVPATVGGETIGHSPNAYFPAVLRRVQGNELSVVVYRETGGSTWDFTAEDGGISNVYGTNLSGVGHPVFKNVGILLVFLTGSPAL